jgi:hypothetical protein
VTLRLADFRVAEIVAAALVALPVPVAAGTAARYAARSIDLREIDRGAAVPIRVKPVLDLDSPAVKLGGGNVRPVMPKEWSAPAPAPPPAQAHVSTKAKDDPAAIPDKSKPMSSAPVPDTSASAAPASSASSAPGADSAAPPGPGSPDGDPDGDPNAKRKMNAAKQYRARVAAFFLSRFRANCTALTEDDKKKLAVAQVAIGGDGTVLSYSMTPGGNAEVDQAAERAMQAVQGQQIPPPPEDFPDLRPNSTSVTFVCR